MNFVLDLQQSEAAEDSLDDVRSCSSWSLCSAFVCVVSLASIALCTP